MPGAPWDRSLVPGPGVEAQRPVDPRSSRRQESHWLQREQRKMSALKWDGGDGGDSGTGGRRARAGAPRSAGQERDIRMPTPGSALSSERVGVPGGHLQTQSRDSWVTPGLAPCLSLPFCEKGASAVSARQPRSPTSPHQGDSLSSAPASGSSIQPERIKEGSEKINKHVGKTQTNPAAANEANSLYANRCLALTRPLRGEDATCQHQLRSCPRLRGELARRDESLDILPGIEGCR